MDSSPAEAAPRLPWPSLWGVALVSLLAQLALCQFFTFGLSVPFTIDVNPSNIWKYAYHFPPRGEFLTLNWFGIANLPPTLNPFSLAAAYIPPWLFFTTYVPLVSTAALFAMTAFLRELDLPRPAALLGGVVYAWQGDLLPFIFPGHFPYITTWPFFALAAWAALRTHRHWAHALIAGASCGMMIGLQPDRGSIASLLIAAFYLTPAVFRRLSPPALLAQLGSLVICVATAALVSFAAFLSLFQSYIVGVKMGAATSREQAFQLCTQFSLGPVESLTYLVPGFFGWHSTNLGGPYWGWIGQSQSYDVSHQGVRNLNLAISTTGTVASLLAIFGVCVLLPGIAGRFFGRDRFTQRQLDFGRVLLGLGILSLVLSWGYHTQLYRTLFALPLMDKWRNPLKWLEIFNFAVVTLSAFGMTQFIRSLGDPVLRRALRFFLLIVTGFLVVLFLTSYPLAILIAAYLNGSYQPIEIANVMHTLHVSLIFAALLAILLWLCLVGAWHGDRLQEWDIVNPWLRRNWSRALSPENRATTLAVCAAVLVTAQMAWVAMQFIQSTTISRIAGSSSLLDSLRAEGPLVRVAVPQPQDSLLNFYLQNQFAAVRISSIDISAASRIPESLTAFVNAFTGHTAKLWMIGGVKTVAIGQGDLPTLRQDSEIAANIASADGYTLGARPDGQPTHALVRMRDYLNKATFVPRAEVVATGSTDKDDEQILKRLADPTWNPRESILLPGDEGKQASGSTAGGPLPPSVPVDVIRYTPHEIDLTIDAPSAGYILINDHYDPDWQAARDGVPIPCLRADYYLRALAVIPGKSTFSLHYTPQYHLGPLTLSIIATNDFSDGVMLLAFIGGSILIRRAKTRA